MKGGQLNPLWGFGQAEGPILEVFPYHVLLLDPVHIKNFVFKQAHINYI